METRDTATRDRLLEAASRLFAEDGFATVTVRDICGRARANVAAVNYHFGGKLGLYESVMQSAIRTMQATTDEARQAGATLAAEGRLRAYVQVIVTRVVAGAGDDPWIHHLMMRELADPTPALGMVLEQVIRPRMAYLSGIVAELLGCAVDDPRAARCAFSVNAQCLALLHHRNAGQLHPAFAMTPAGLDATVDHITEFSLAGLWALARSA